MSNTNHDTKAVRAEFEAWLESEKPPRQMHYADQVIDGCWHAYEAATSKSQERIRDSERVALDIAMWFVNGDRPDEWKLKEWAERLDRESIDKAYAALKEPK
jgi:hypothetical protein